MAMDFPDVDTAKKQEAERRVWCLGPLTAADVDASCLYKRARQIWIPPLVLSKWRQRYLAEGAEGLQPEDWVALSPADQENILQRLDLLGKLAQDQAVTWAAVKNQAKLKQCSKRTVGRWLSRYRVAGLWGLAHGSDPKPHPSPTKGTARRLPEPGTLTEDDLVEIQRRRGVLGKLARKEHLTAQEVQDRATKKQVSERTLRGYWHDFRAYGFLGLAPLHRSDKDQHHKISTRMVEIIEGIRLSYPDFPIRATWEEACKRARLLGEVEPSVWQVRAICEDIPNAVRLLADRREKEFRDGTRLTHRVDWSGQPCTILIDHVHPLHILVRDLRPAPWRVESGEVRPYMTLAFERGSRLAPAVRLSYDAPDRFQVGACIRDLLRASPLKPFVVTPDDIWVDNGKDLVSHYVWQLTMGLGINLHPCFPHDPEARGVIERFFRTLNTRLLAKLPGYTGSNPTERNPAAKGELTIAQVEDEIKAFLATYHREEHSETGQTPWAYWDENFMEDPPNERLLDMLLKEPDERVVFKGGIKYEGRVYWDAAFAELVGELVVVRAAPSYAAPDELEVYFQDHHICTALAIDSPAGKAVTPRQIAQAQRHQRGWARAEKQQARQTLQGIDQQLAEQGHEVSVMQTSTPPAPPPSSPAPQPSRSPQPAQEPDAEERDMWDDLLEQGKAG